MDESFPVFNLFAVKKRDSSRPLGPSKQVEGTVLNPNKTTAGEVSEGWVGKGRRFQEASAEWGEEPVARFQLEVRWSGGWGHVQTWTRGVCTRVCPQESLRAGTGSYWLSHLPLNAVDLPRESESRQVHVEILFRRLHWTTPPPQLSLTLSYPPLPFVDPFLLNAC